MNFHALPAETPFPVSRFVLQRVTFHALAPETPFPVLRLVLLRVTFHALAAERRVFPGVDYTV